jgi:hypothetical protein
MVEGLQDYDELACAIRGVMSGWQFVHPPQSFGWTPDRHLRSTMTKGSQTADIVIRRSWTDAGFRTESFLYRSVFPHMALRTPKLWGAFTLDSDHSEWMVLEDLGNSQLTSESLNDRVLFLSALGQLHGEGLRLAERHSICPPTCAALSQLPDCLQLLASGISDPFYGLSEDIWGLADHLCDKLAEHPITLIHGDTDMSNAIRVGDKAILVDWERAGLGPPSLDIGKILEMTESSDELNAYRVAYCQASGETLSPDQLQDWADVGDIYNCTKWISYYIGRAQEGDKPDEGWRRNHYDPCVERLAQLIVRRPDWGRRS